MRLKVMRLMRLTQSSDVHLAIDLKSVTDHSVVKSDPQHTEG